VGEVVQPHGVGECFGDARLKHFQALYTFDQLPLLHQLRRQPELWKQDTYLRDYPQGPFQDVETVFLRFPPASVTEMERSAKDQHECLWMDAAIHLPAARPLIFYLMQRVEGERLGRCMINKIRPGGRIFPHADTPDHVAYYERYHMVLQSGAGCVFRCGDEELTLPVGQCWWFEHGLEHEVNNNGAIDRIHLIVDIHHSDPYRGVTPTVPA
jgi:mannose-6-phosphate isomerase-like protein (cupin superfamily)